MVNLTINDVTQKNILEHLAVTEKLLSKVATKLSGTAKSAQIYAMPDLGIAQNGTRMIGGFYTGACYTWDTDVPFIPIDTTVNVCGTAVYRLKKNISNQEFVQRLDSVMRNHNTYEKFVKKYLSKEILNSIDIKDSSKFYWNYDKGNHFVILAETDGEYGLPAGQYLIVHASAIEFKKDNLEYGLYPVKGNWYYNDIQTEYDEYHHRYIRFITGNKAKRFYSIASNLREFNKTRNRYFCQSVLDDLMGEEIINISHYGMPTINSVCIGVQWEQCDYTLLTAPGNDVFLIHPDFNQNIPNSINLNGQSITITPHGCGVKMNNPTDEINYHKDGISIGSKDYHIGESVNIGTDVSVRTSNFGDTELNLYIKQILSICPGQIFGRLTQRFARTKYGDFNYQKEKNKNATNNIYETRGNSL